MALAGCANDQSGTTPQTEAGDLRIAPGGDRGGPFLFPIRARVVAQGIPGAGAITQVGTFHRGSPIHDKPVFAAFAAPGMVLDPARLLVASSSSFGAPLARPDDAPGSVLSIDVSQGLVTVDPALAAAGGQAKSADGRAQIYANQDPAFLNSINNPAAATAAFPSASLPLGLSLNRGGGRPWIANAPTGASGAGTTALMTKSPDASTKAVFAAAEADGSIVQVHVLKGVDALAPAGTFHGLGDLSVAATQSTNPDVVTRVGMVFNWVPNRTLFVSDPLGNQVVAVDLTDDGTMFHAATRPLQSVYFRRPVDLAPAVPEVAADNFASNTTLGGGSDIYVLNRGNNSIVRITQRGDVVGAFRIDAPVSGFRVNGLAVSENAQTLWVTAAVPGGDGVVLELPAFGAGFITPTMVAHARAHGAADPLAMGADMFATDLSPFQGVGPLFNARACGDCHNNPMQGGMGATPATFVTRVGRIDGGTFDPLLDGGGPIARTHS
ncbi:MAG: hypothetical protein ABUS79_19260, partial [Pseudomonadota bacterium]